MFFTDTISDPAFNLNVKKLRQNHKVKALQKSAVPLDNQDINNRLIEMGVISFTPRTILCFFISQIPATGNCGCGCSVHDLLAGGSRLRSSNTFCH